MSDWPMAAFAEGAYFAGFGRNSKGERAVRIERSGVAIVVNLDNTPLGQSAEWVARRERVALRLLTRLQGGAWILPCVEEFVAGMANIYPEPEYQHPEREGADFPLHPTAGKGSEFQPPSLPGRFFGPHDLDPIDWKEVGIAKRKGTI